MNVGELIKALDEFPSDMDVMIPDETGSANLVFLHNAMKQKVVFDDDDDDHPEDFEAVCLMPI